MRRGNNEDFLLRCTKYAEKRRWSHLVQAFHTALAKVAAVPEAATAAEVAAMPEGGAGAVEGAEGVPAGGSGGGCQAERSAAEQGAGQQRERKRRKVAAGTKSGGSSAGETPAAVELRKQVSGNGGRRAMRECARKTAWAGV